MNRERLPQRRRVERFNLDVGGLSYVAECGFYPDGRLGEIFLNSGKSGTHLSIATQEIAIAVSFALQHGCEVEVMRSAFPRTAHGTAEGVMGKLLDELAGGVR